jgi:hypothetical protein
MRNLGAAVLAPPIQVSRYIGSFDVIESKNLPVKNRQEAGRFNLLLKPDPLTKGNICLEK